MRSDPYVERHAASEFLRVAQSMQIQHTVSLLVRM